MEGGSGCVVHATADRRGEQVTPLARFVRRRRTAFVPPRIEDVRTLDPAARDAAKVVWQRRHANERASVDLAERMQRYARALGADEQVDALARLAEDEREHVGATGAVLDALAAPRTAAAPIRAPDSSEPPELSFARDVAVGLALCETVSAARFAAVRAATDIAVFRRLIDGFLRDEVAHAALGMALLPCARDGVRRTLGDADGDAWLTRELSRALVELESTVGLDGARRGLMPPRPQPRGNPGIIEPNLDAIAFYDAVAGRILPRVERCGLPIRAPWESRFACMTARAMRSE